MVSIYIRSNNVLNLPRKQATISRGGSIMSVRKSISEQWRLRIEADPDFIAKSITEVILAIGTQLAAEFGRRGKSRMITEIDFVVAGILTAMAGKYYSMWRVAPTGTATSSTNKNDKSTEKQISNIPTNAFQNDRPYTLFQRCAAFITPVPSLFQAGFIASTIGYGLTAILVFLRTVFVPTYEAATVNVNILHASLYTGAFMAVVSNIRYQLLQGIIEPKIIERIFNKVPVVKAGVIFIVRLANGLLGSSLAISGMRMFGLQKLK